jgi:hypothetical protein
MAPIYSSLVIGFILILFILTLLRARISKLLGISLVFSQCFCLIHISMNQPSQVVWLCNVVVFMQIFLLFKFNQKIFDMVFYFAWTGCFIICFMPNNPYALMLKSTPIFWVTYWLKHLIPLVIPIYFLHVQKRKLSGWSIYTGALYFLIYCGSVYLYNLVFNQNIFYLMEPAPFMGGLGKFYFLISITLGYLWFATLYVIASSFGWVRGNQEREEQKLFKITSQSPESGES